MLIETMNGLRKVFFPYENETGVSGNEIRTCLSENLFYEESRKLVFEQKFLAAAVKPAYSSEGPLFKHILSVSAAAA